MSQKKFFYNKSQDNLDLHKLLQDSVYVPKLKKEKIFNPKCESYKPPSPPHSREFRTIFELIKQMRINRNAAVDVDGPQNLYDKDAPINDQRFQILVALLLSPQTKDEITGMLMRRLLRLPLTIELISDIPEDELKALIFECNFNTTKTRRIIRVAQRVQFELQGVMPTTYDSIMAFEGVGEKIALLYMGVAFRDVYMLYMQIQQWMGIAVDVNLMRVCNRIPIANANDPAKMRLELERIVPRAEWEDFNQIVVGFGQQICRINGRELCSECLLNKICDFCNSNTKVKDSKGKDTKSKKTASLKKVSLKKKLDLQELEF